MEDIVVLIFGVCSHNHLMAWPLTLAMVASKRHAESSALEGT
jgi:hypothetical protein